MDTSIQPCRSQTWVFTNKIKNKILRCQRAMERSILKIRKKQMIRCDRIRNETNLTDALKHCLVSKWKWAGHIARVKDKRWSQRVTHWAGPTGKRKIDKPKKKMGRQHNLNCRRKLDGRSTRQRKMEKIGGGLYPKH